MSNFNLTLHLQSHLFLICGWIETNKILLFLLLTFYQLIGSFIIGLFEANDTMGMGLARQLKALLEKFGFKSKVLCSMKDKGTNLWSMTTTLKSMISCEALNLPQPFDGACFGHVMNKATQYATNDLAPISVKSTQ